MYKLQHVRPKLYSEEFGKARRKLTNNQAEELQEARKQGESALSLASMLDVNISTIANRFKVSVMTLYNTLRRNQWPR